MGAEDRSSSASDPPDKAGPGSQFRPDRRRFDMESSLSGTVHGDLFSPCHTFHAKANGYLVPYNRLFHFKYIPDLISFDNT